MILNSKILVYVLAGVFSLSVISSLVNNIKDYFKEPTFTKDAVELMLKHQKLKNENETLLLEINVLEKDNERISKSIGIDSTRIYNSSRLYRDSIRAILNPM